MFFPVLRIDMLRALLLWLVIAGVDCLLPGWCAAGDEQLNQGIAALADQQYEQAVLILNGFIANHPNDPKTSQARCACAQALASLGRHDEALVCFKSALAQNESRLRLAPVRLACAKCAIQLERYEEAAEHATEAIQAAQTDRERSAAYPMLIGALCNNRCTDQAWSRLQQWIAQGNLPQDQLLAFARQIGATALLHQQPETAREVFAWHMKSNTQLKEQQEAALGFAWAEAALATTPDEAAQSLLQFATEHPQAAGSAKTLLSAAQKQIEAGQRDQALKSLQQLISSYPQSEHVPKALSLSVELAQALEDPEMVARCQELLVTHHITDTSSRPLVSVLLADAAAKGDNDKFERIVTALFGASDPELIQFVMHQLDSEASREVVIRFAECGLQRLIDPDQITTTRPIVQWLYQNQQWSAVTEAASKLPVDVLVADMHQGAQIAECFYQTGNANTALDLFERLAQRDGHSFAIALRRAELAAQCGSLPQAAQAVAAAGDAATSSAEQNLVQIVAAQLDIRQSNFDAARKTLQSIVLSPTADEPLRGRALWMVGETHFMQRQYSEAIDAYRRCETLFPNSGWAAAALLQAGKSFEKLGNFRESAVCYTNLLNQYPKSPYTRLASTRLGWIGNQKNR